MSPINNVNVNVLYTKPNVNNNVNVDNRITKARMVDATVDKLQAKLKANDQSRPFLCKAVWKLSETQIWSNCDSALKGNNPMGLFIFLCKRDGV